MISLRTPQHRTSMLEFLGKDLAAPRCTGSDGRHVAGGRRRERVGREAGATGMRRRQIAIGMLNDVQCPQKVTVNDMAMSPALKLKAAVQYAVSRSGHLSNAGIYAGALVRTDPRLEEPDLQINMSGWSAIERLRTGIKPHPFSAFTFSPVHLRPDGRGWVRIKSPDPLAPPAIQFNFLASDYDFQALIYGMRLSRKITAQPAMKPFVAEEVLPGSQVENEADMIQEIRVRGVSNLHPVGTCRMGREVDAVVDPRLRVHGIERLRVADASIMPQVPGGNTNAPSIMIGEKCAAMILEDARAA